MVNVGPLADTMHYSASKCSILPAISSSSAGSKRLHPDNSTVLPCGERQVEVHMLRDSKQIDVGLICENFPIWMNGLEPSKVRYVHVLGFVSQIQFVESLEAQGFASKILQRLLMRFGAHQVVIITLATSNRTFLVLS
jgi:hypothetical protein